MFSVWMGMHNLKPRFRLFSTFTEWDCDSRVHSRDRKQQMNKSEKVSLLLVYWNRWLPKCCFCVGKDRWPKSCTWNEAAMYQLLWAFTLLTYFLLSFGPLFEEVRFWGSNAHVCTDECKVGDTLTCQTDCHRKVLFTNSQIPDSKESPQLPDQKLTLKWRYRSTHLLPSPIRIRQWSLSNQALLKVWSYLPCKTSPLPLLFIKASLFKGYDC